MEQNKDKEIRNKLSINEILSYSIYISYLIISIFIWFENLAVYEVLFRFWVISYMVVMYNLFVDKKPPKYFDLNKYLEKDEEEKYYEEYLKNLMAILNATMKSIRFIEEKAYREKYREELEHNLKVVQVSYNRLKRLKVPPKYLEAQEGILKDIETFIRDYERICNEDSSQTTAELSLNK